MTDDPKTDDPDALARSRFLLMTLARFASIAFVFAGIANVAGKLLPVATPWLGYLVFFAGVGSFYSVPVWLKRRWRSSSE